MKPTIFKFIRSDKKEYIFDGGNWGIVGISGIDYPTIQLFTQTNAIGNGSVKTGQRLTDREITLQARLQDALNNEIVRQSVIQFFNSNYTFKLYITYQGVTRWIDVNIIGFSCPSINVYKPLELSVSVLALDPYFNSVDNFGKNLAEVTPFFHFPYVNLIGETIPVSYFAFSTEVHILNDGDEYTNMVVTFTAKGNVTNPKLIKGDYYVEILDTMVDNDVIVMDFENLTVTKNGTNIINKVNKESNFTEMQLEIGNNIISFEAEENSVNLDVTVTFYKKYGGM
jgi:hypothetical protein